ncbi:MAG: hypothetical protein OSJ72_17070 [Lachnospiraceae bacterium]|nr:hypothetical protein [Lachnospiraceae bacterium]
MVLSFDAMFALVTAFSIVTSLLTQTAKVFLDALKVEYASNIVVMVVAVLVGTAGTSLYYVNYQIPFNALTSVYLAIMCLLNCAGAMVGYDKVRQLITQLKEIRHGQEAT